MREYPTYRLCGVMECQTRRHRRPVDQYHRNSLDQSRFQLGLGADTTSVLGDYMGYPVALKQGEVVCKPEGAARDQGCGVGQRQGAFGRIDQTQKIVVLGFGGKSAKRLFADGQKDTARIIGQGGNSGLYIRNHVPVIARPRHPGRTHQCAQRHAGCGAGGYGIAADLCGKGVCGIDDMGDLIGADVICQPRIATKSTDAGWQRLRDGLFGSARVGKDCIYPGARQFPRQRRRFGRATQEKDSRHV